VIQNSSRARDFTVPLSKRADQSARFATPKSRDCGTKAGRSSADFIETVFTSASGGGRPHSFAKRVSATIRPTKLSWILSHAGLAGRRGLVTLRLTRARSMNQPQPSKCPENVLVYSILDVRDNRKRLRAEKRSDSCLLPGELVASVSRRFDAPCGESRSSDESSYRPDLAKRSPRSRSPWLQSSVCSLSGRG
jgi:hypothetical protein